MDLGRLKAVICEFINESKVTDANALYRYDPKTGAVLPDVLVHDRLTGTRLARFTLEPMLLEEAACYPCTVFTYLVGVEFGAGKQYLKFHEGNAPLSRKEIVEALQRMIDATCLVGKDGPVPLLRTLGPVRVESRREFEMSVPEEVRVRSRGG